MIPISSPSTRKGLLFGLLLSLLFLPGTASAQHCIGGSISFGGENHSSSYDNSNKTGEETHTHSTSISIKPDFRWLLGEKWAAGIRPSAGLTHQYKDEENTTDFDTHSIGLEAYARYKVLTFNRLGLWAEATPGIRLYWDHDQNNGSTSSSSDYSSELSHRDLYYSFEILPVLTYQLNSRFSLETQIPFISLSLSGNRHICHSNTNYNPDLNYPNSSSDHDSSNFTYSLNASMMNVIGWLNAFNISVLYHF